MPTPLVLFKEFYRTRGSLVSYLESNGYTGTINDAMYAYLGDEGYTGALNDRLRNAELDGLDPGGTVNPPVLSALTNQSFVENTGDQVYALAGLVTGLVVTWSLTSAPSGVTINSSTGVITFDTDTLALQSGTTITVTATNAGGSDVETFDLAVTAVAPVLTLNSFDDVQDVWDVSTDHPSQGNYHWARAADGTTGLTADGSGGWTGGTVIESGTAAVPANGVDVDLPTTGTGDQPYELFLYQRADNADSNVLTTGYIENVTAPSGLTVTPVQAYADTAATTVDPTYTIDLSSFTSGGKLIVFYGNNVYPTTAEYETNSMTAVAAATNSGQNSSQRMSTYEYDFSAGASDDELSFTVTTNNQSAYGAVVVEGGSIASGDIGNNQTGSAIDNVVTAASGDILVSVAITNAAADGVTWTGTTAEETDSTVNVNVDLAVNSSPSVGSNTVTATPTVASGRLVAATLVISED